jgi:hypothetical protein
LTPGSSYTGGFGSVTNLPANSYYDAAEEVGDWLALGGYEVIDGVPGTFMPGATEIDFAAPPQSGATFVAVFVNTPTQGCTPGFWGGGSDGGQAGGQWLWDVENDPDWYGEGTNPYFWEVAFGEFFTPSGNDEVDALTIHYLVNTGGGSLDEQKAARSLVAAYLNASWGMAFAYTVDELLGMWSDAVNGTITFLDLHTQLDAANNYYNNPDGSCPISASF